MTKYGIREDERWPDYSLVEGETWYGSVDLTDAEYQDYLRVAEEYEAWQDRIKAGVVKKERAPEV